MQLHEQAAEHATHRVGKPFLEAMLAASGGEHHERGWENVLRTAFADLKSASFKEPWRINAKLLVLDVLLQPQPLQHALVRCFAPSSREMWSINEA